MDKRQSAPIGTEARQRSLELVPAAARSLPCRSEQRHTGTRTCHCVSPPYIENVALTVCISRPQRGHTQRLIASEEMSARSCSIAFVRRGRSCMESRDDSCPVGPKKHGIVIGVYCHNKANMPSGTSIRAKLRQPAQGSRRITRLSASLPSNLLMLK